MSLRRGQMLMLLALAALCCNLVAGSPGRSLSLFQSGKNDDEPQKCANQHSKCNQWAEQGECDGSYSDMMAEKCPKACNKCKSDSAEDSEIVTPEDEEKGELVEDEKATLAEEEPVLPDGEENESETATKPEIEIPSPDLLRTDRLELSTWNKEQTEHDDHEVVVQVEEEDEPLKDVVVSNDVKETEESEDPIIDDSKEVIADEEETVTESSDSASEEPVENERERIGIAQMLMDRAGATLALSHAYESVDGASKLIQAAESEVKKFLSSHAEEEAAKASGALLTKDLDGLIKFSKDSLTLTAGSMAVDGTDETEKSAEADEEETVSSEDVEVDIVSTDEEAAEDASAGVIEGDTEEGSSQDTAEGTSEEEEDEEKESSDSSCEDTNSKCEMWAEKGECNGDFLDVMREKCPKSCGICESTKAEPKRSLIESSRPGKDSIVTNEEEDEETSPCEDIKGEEKCAKWEKMGECDGEYKERMLEFCAKTCGVCKA